MDRRSFIVLTLAGCADPQLTPTPAVMTPAPGPAPTPVSTGPSGTSGDPNFDSWISGFYNRARAAGVRSAACVRRDYR